VGGQEPTNSECSRFGNCRSWEWGPQAGSDAGSCSSAFQAEWSSVCCSRRPAEQAFADMDAWFKHPTAERSHQGIGSDRIQSTLSVGCEIYHCTAEFLDGRGEWPLL